MKTYKTVGELAEAMISGEIPADVVSPGYAAQLLGVSRQAINDRIHKSKSLEAWGAEGTVLISTSSINAVLEKRKAEGQEK